MANGMSLDRKGRLLICEQGRLDERARISRIKLKTRALETIVDAWRGLPFNSPNDAVERSDGTIWFTDPNYGELQGFKPAAKIGAYVETGETSVVADSFDKPNGLAFSPDERILYITDSGANQAPGTYFIHLPHHIRAFDVNKGRHLRGDRLFATISPGYPDGIKVDTRGRVNSRRQPQASKSSHPMATCSESLLLQAFTTSLLAGRMTMFLLILGDTKIWQAQL